MAFTLSNLQQTVTKNLLDVFSMLPGEKVLLVDSTLLQPLDRVASMSFLRQVHVTKVMKLADLPPKGEFPRMAYLIPPDFEATMNVIRHCDVDRINQVASRRRLVVFVPQTTPDVLYLLESRGHAGHRLCTAGVSLGWNVIDEDLVSLNLPTLFPDYYLYGDSTWPHFMGTQVGELLEATSNSPLVPLGCRVHAFGESAKVVVSGVRLYCIRSGLVKGMKKPSVVEKKVSHAPSMSSIDSMTSSSSSAALSTHAPPPLVIIFSRDYDYVSPLLVPMTFEALIHETLGIDMGFVELPSAGPDEPRKLQLASSKMYYYKLARGAHVARLPGLLRHWQLQLQKTHSSVEKELSTSVSLSASLTSGGRALGNLRHVSAQVGPILAKKRELSFLLRCMGAILESMTRQERVEDLRTAQTLLLQSGSGDSLALPSTTAISASAPVPDPPSVDGGVDVAEDRIASVAAFSGSTPTAGGCGTLADSLDAVPIRLAIEWLSTHHGNRLIDGIRLLALASVTHGGLGADLFPVAEQAILHAVGQSAFPMLFALSSLGLLSSRDSGSSPAIAVVPVADTTPSVASSSTVLAYSGGRSALSAAKSRLRLATRRRSQYNRLHQLLRLSHSGQVNRRFDLPPVSPTYVYGGQHCPVVVRLSEAVWFYSLNDPPGSGRAAVVSSPSPDSVDGTHKKAGMGTGGVGEIVPKQQLVSALKCLTASDEAANSLGMVNFADPSFAAAGYQSETLRSCLRPNAPLPHPLPLAATNQPVVVVFPGGCTYGEIAALRFAANRRRWNLLVATSCLLTSRDLLQQAGQVACHRRVTEDGSLPTT